MALAQKLAIEDRMMDGSAARPLPQIEREPRRAPKARPATRTKKGIKSVVLGTLGWLLIVGVCLFVVHSNTAVLAETGKITDLRDQLAQEQRKTEELKTTIVAEQSLQKVDEWAAAHGMIRPTNIKTVAGDPTAVAVRPQPAAQPAAQPAPRGASILDAIKAAMASLSGKTAEAGAAH